MGRSLLESLCKSTGLPYESIYTELEGLVKQSGLDIDKVTLDELREVLAEYLQEVLVSAQQKFS